MKKLSLTVAVLLSMANLHGYEFNPVEQPQIESATSESPARPKDKTPIVHFLAAFGDTQILSTAPAFIHLPNTTIKPVGLKTVAGDDSKIEVKHTGIYSIVYHLGVSSSTALDLITTQLVLNGVLVAGTERVVQAQAVDAPLIINHPTILQLKRGDILQLQISNSAGGSYQAINPGITIIEILN